MKIYLYYVYNRLLGTKESKPILHKCDAKRRMDKLKLFLPSCFIDELTKRAVSYQTWVMQEDAYYANSLFQVFAGLLGRDSRNILPEVDALALSVLNPDGRDLFDKVELEKLLFEECCANRTEFIENPTYRNRLKFHFDTKPARALSRMILFLSLGTCAREHLELVLPEDELQFYSIAPDSANVSYYKEPMERFHFAELLYKEGQHKSALSLFLQIADEISDPSLYYRIGTMYELGDGCEKSDESAISYYQKSVPANLNGCYKLFQYAKDPVDARHYFKLALDGHLPDAVRDCGIALYHGDSRLGYKKNREEARKYFEEGACVEHPEDGDATCQYMLGLYALEQEHSIQESMNWFEQAAKKGHSAAIEQLQNMSLSMHFQQASASDVTRTESSSEPELNICFLNSLNADDLMFLKSLPLRNWEIILLFPEEACQQKDLHEQRLAVTGLPFHFSTCYGNIRYAISKYLAPYKPSKAEILFHLFDHSDQRNMNNALEILEELKTLQKADPKYALFLSQSVSVYLSSKSASAELIIDSVNNVANDYYIKVILCNPYQNATEWLYSRAPLFLPCINSSNESTHLVLLGDGACIPWLIRNAFGLGYSGRPLHITVISTHASETRQLVQNLCPGIFHHPELFKASLTFLDADFGAPDFWKMASYAFGSEIPEEALLAKALQQANYFVLASDDDLFNVEKSTELRSNLIKYDPNFSRLPFIAAYCRDSQLSWQTRHFVVGNEKAGYNWYNNYDIYCFGSPSELYSYESLTNSPIDRRALQVHLSYYGNIRTPEAHYQACRDYYSRTYNQDSSKSCAVNLIYRFFAAGIFLPQWKDYGIPDKEFHLASSYADWLNDTNLETAARLEHERWNMYMLSRGWETATMTQMATYLQKGNPRQQLYIAKLHPFLCSWDDLGDDSYGVQLRTNQILKGIRPGSANIDIKEIDRQNILATLHFYEGDDAL